MWAIQAKRVLTLAYVINVCETTTGYTKETTNAVVSTIVESERMAEMTNLVNELKESSDMPFTVWSMFDINRRFALSYLLALIRVRPVSRRLFLEKLFLEFFFISKHFILE